MESSGYYYYYRYIHTSLTMRPQIIIKSNVVSNEDTILSFQHHTSTIDNKSSTIMIIITSSSYSLYEVIIHGDNYYKENSSITEVYDLFRILSLIFVFNR